MKNNLKLFRIMQNLSQEELSLLTGIDQPLISKFERGYKKPNPEQLKYLSEALQLSVEELKRQLQD